MNIGTILLINSAADFIEISPVRKCDFEVNADRTLSIYKNFKMKAEKGPEGQLFQLPILC